MGECARRTQGASIVVTIGATEDARACRPARPDGSGLIVRSAPVALTAVEVLFEEPGLAEPDLPEELLQLYGGGLGVEGPCLVANFVQTIDGVVAVPSVPRS